jgi:hypothetical protein
MVSFYVYKLVLSLSPPFFKDPPPKPQPHEHPIIPCTEGSRALDSPLRLCYSVIKPVIKGLSDIELVLEAALTYQTEEATETMKKSFLTLVADNTLRVYVIACRLQLEEEARAAAHCWMEQCPETSSHPGINGVIPPWNATSAGARFTPEMTSISTGCLFRLLRHVRTNTMTSRFKSEGAQYSIHCSMTTPTL